MGWAWDGMGMGDGGGSRGKIILVDVWLSLCLHALITDGHKEERKNKRTIRFFFLFFFLSSSLSHSHSHSLSLSLSLFSFPSLLIRECRYVLRAHTCFPSAASLIGVGGWELRH